MLQFGPKIMLPQDIVNLQAKQDRLASRTAALNQRIALIREHMNETENPPDGFCLDYDERVEHARRESYRILAEWDRNQAETEACAEQLSAILTKYQIDPSTL
jgi:hypothetical protein